MAETNTELQQRWAKADPATWTDIEVMAKEQAIPLDQVTGEIQATLALPFIQSLPEQERFITALRAQKARLTNGFLAKADPYEVFVLDHTSPQARKTKKGVQHISNVVGIGRKAADGAPVGFVNISFWDEFAPLSLNFEPGKAYRVMCTGKMDGSTYSLGANKRTHAHETIEMKVNPVEAVRQFFPVVPIAKISEHISKSPSDLKLVRANVVSGRIIGRKDGTNSGMFFVVDDSQTAKEVQNKGGLRIWADVAQVRYGGGSSVYFLGRVSPGKEGTEYGPSMNCVATVPEFVLPLETPVEVGDRPQAETPQTAPTNQEVADFSQFNQKK